MFPAILRLCSSSSKLLMYPILMLCYTHYVMQLWSNYSTSVSTDPVDNCVIYTNNITSVERAKVKWPLHIRSEVPDTNMYALNGVKKLRFIWGGFLESSSLQFSFCQHYQPVAKTFFGRMELNGIKHWCKIQVSVVTFNAFLNAHGAASSVDAAEFFLLVLQCN